MGADLTATFTLEGDEEMKEKIRQLAPLYVDATKRGMENWAESIMASSKREYVPVDTGALKNSGHVMDATEGEGSLDIEFGYSQEYAAAVHEVMPPRATHVVGQAKYLEVPMILKSGELLPRVAQMIKAAVEGRF